jgi:hypothetical protein
MKGSVVSISRHVLIRWQFRHHSSARNKFDWSSVQTPASARDLQRRQRPAVRRGLRFFTAGAITSHVDSAFPHPLATPFSDVPAAGASDPLGDRRGGQPFTDVQTLATGDRIMPKFMSSHTMPAGSLKREQFDQISLAKDLPRA